MCLLESLAILIPSLLPVSVIGLDGPCWEIIDFSQFFAGPHEVFLGDDIDLEAGVIVIGVLVEAFFVHGVGGLIGGEDERLGVAEEGEVALGVVQGLDH